MIGGGNFAGAVFHGIRSAIKISYIKHVIALHNAHIEICKIYYKIYSMQLCISYDIYFLSPLFVLIFHRW